MLTKDRTEDLIRTLLSDITLNNDFKTAPADSDLNGMGLDSLGIIELIHGLENRFKIRLADEDVLPENFDSIHSITQLVRTKHANQ
jgi:acyl carrier protein